MAPPGTAQLPIGSISTGLTKSEEVQEYEKILRISEDIFSGVHPRLKIPQQLVRKTASRNAPHPPISTQSQVKTAGLQGSSPSSRFQVHPATAEVASAQATTPVNGPPGAVSTALSSRIIPKPASEIDPIFLTKSDDLVRAELQLQRQRVERALREQLEQKKQESRQRAAIQDTKPDFDVSDVLNKALEIVKPSPLLEAAGPSATTAPSESFDENSFYSSRAPDSPQQGDQQGPSPAPASNSEDLATDVPVENYSDELQRLEALNKTGAVQEIQNAYPVADFANDRFQETQQQTDAYEEPEYSPPAPGVAPMASRESNEFQRGYPSGAKGRGPEGRLPNTGRYARKSISPSDDMRVVQNHITSPAAPQPSRVSPLAIAKVPSVPQSKYSRAEYSSDRIQHGGQELRGASPDVSPQQLMPRKRRRVQEERNRPRQVSYRAQHGDASERYIKEEPVSPPPFADTPPTFRARQPHDRPVYIDIASPQYTPVLERNEPSMQEPAYELDPYHEIHVEPGIQRAVSRLSVRRPVRDDQDLRRVASLHQARHTEYAREYIDPSSSRSVRAASYAVVERPPQERIRYYDEVSPSYTRRYVPAGESPTSPRYREMYYEEEPPSRVMAPPTRRIVVDEHGNQYYETPVPRTQAMPPPSSRIAKGDVYDDRVPMRPASVVRAASVIDDPYASRRYVQEMPPPPGAYRRVTEYPQPAPSERRHYAAPLDEREPFPRSSSVQVAEYPRTAYIEETELPRERIIRIPSVRPPTVRYEEPRELIPRLESVRPSGGDVNVYMDDDARRPREYYVSTRPLPREEQYFDSGEPERVMLDGREAVHRAPQRY